MRLLLLIALVLVAGCTDATSPDGVAGGDQIPAGKGRVKVDLSATACPNADSVVVYIEELYVGPSSTSTQTFHHVRRGRVSTFDVDTGRIILDISFEPRPTGYRSQHNDFRLAEGSDTTFVVSCE